VFAIRMREKREKVPSPREFASGRSDGRERECLGGEKTLPSKGEQRGEISRHKKTTSLREAECGRGTERRGRERG